MADTPVYGVIFDLMGTLATYTGNTEALHAARRQGAQALYAYLATQGLTATPDTFAAALRAATATELARHGNNPRAVAVTDVLAVVIAEFALPLSPMQIAGAERAYFGPELDGWEILPGAFETVETLNEEGLRLAVVSNAPSHLFVEETIARIGLRPFMSPVMSSAEAGVSKPDPRIFLAVATEWQLAPEYIVVVGDGRANDIAGAHAAGMRGVLVHGASNPDNHDSDDTDTAQTPDADVPGIAAVPALLTRWQAAVADGDRRPETGFIEEF